ncbi:MAG: hypothetical protein WD063_04150 [Pirellulales bacterium]
MRRAHASPEGSDRGDKNRREGIDPGLPRPAYTGIHTDYWAQGLNFGLAYRF